MNVSSHRGNDRRAGAASSAAAAPKEPEVEEPPDSPAQVPASGWTYVARKAVREFLTDHCIDLAAGLTYFAVLAIFPAILAVFSLLGVIGQADETVRAIEPILTSVLGDSAADTLLPVIRALATAPGAGVALVSGLIVALWSASGYVTAFSRAMNRIYGVEEGRPIWKLRPVMLLITLIILVLVVLVALMALLSGGVATAIGEAIGLGAAVITVWQIAKWPVALALVIIIVAILYYATPNVKQPKFRWLSVGATLAIIVWIIASVGFGFYIVNVANYAKTYGALAGVIVFLLWLWITNLALLLGAEVDAELERVRELLAGVPAEREIQLPVRDDTKIVKDTRKSRADIARGRELRETEG